MLKFIRALFDPWEYGTKEGVRARRHRWDGRVQLVLWKAGEQGHAVDYWHNFGPGHEKLFVKDPS